MYLPLEGRAEHEGEWYLPDDPTRRVGGRLTFDPERGSVLDLIGSLQPEEELSEQFAPAIVHGISSLRARPITLVGCVETAKEITSGRGGGMVTSRIRPTFALVGHHFTDQASVVFSTGYLELSDLAEWAILPGVDIALDPPETVVIRYKRPAAVQLARLEPMLIEIVAIPELPGMRMVQTEARVAQRAVVRINPQTGISLKELLRRTRELQQLFTLLVGEGVRIRSVGGAVAPGTGEPNGATSEVDVLFQPALGLPGARDNLLPVEMLLPRTVIGDGLVEVASTWFELYHSLKPVLDLTFATILSDNLYVDQVFLALAQAIESFHRRTSPSEVPSQHLDRLRRVLSSQSREDREWLEEKLRYSHEPSLRRRLKELVAGCPEIQEYLGSTNRFIDDVVTTRNYLTHYDETIRARALRGEAMFHANQKLRGLITVALLKRIGVPEGAIRQALAGRSKQARYLRLAAERSV